MEFGWPIRVRQVREIVNRGEMLRVDHRMLIEGSLPHAPNRSAAWPQLAHEIDRALSRGYVDRFFLSGNAECTNPMPDEAFLKVVAKFNETLEGLHRRFPRLAGVVPPNLSQNDAAVGYRGVLGLYRFLTETLEFANKDSAYFDSYCEKERRRSRASPRPPGLKGVVTHEYSHHLSSPSVCSCTYWIPRLIELLQRQGFVASDTRLNAGALSSPSLTLEVGNSVREMGLGTYASTNLWEFAAEALTWRMAETYGESQEIPRMPRFLEAWVHDCFPFTRDGPIPSGFVEFHPAAIKEPMMAGGQFQCVNRGTPPRPLPRPRPL